MVVKLLKHCWSRVQALWAGCIKSIDVSFYARSQCASMMFTTECLQMRAIKTSLAYFVYDFFCCLVVFPRDIGNAVHHIITIMGLGYGFMTQTVSSLGSKYLVLVSVVYELNLFRFEFCNTICLSPVEVLESVNLFFASCFQCPNEAKDVMQCGTELVACLWLMELSNPFMHARELFKEFGIKDTPLNMANDVS